MPRTAAQLEEASRRADAWLDSMDPAQISAPEADASDLRAIADTTRNIARDHADQAAAVEVARRNGRTWTQIAAMLGLTRQAAKAKFGEPAAL